MTESTDSSLQDRMDEDYEPPILVEPQGGPVPGGPDPDLDDDAEDGDKPE